MLPVIPARPLRHFLKDEEVPLFVTVDPYLNVFESIESQPNLLQAYPCLAKPVNFLACHAEALPFRQDAFDWVHMRSCLDHFASPYLALLEAYRVLRPEGALLLGLSIAEKEKPKPVSTLKALRNRLRSAKAAFRNRIAGNSSPPGDGHLFHLTCDHLRDLLALTGFRVEKEHWQKPPHAHCLYLSARPLKSARTARLP
jgi:SAM-dependent methyltransferase